MKYKIYDNSINFSGNQTTLNRLSEILKLEITNKIEDNIIGIHAYKFGSKLEEHYKQLKTNKKINFILILGGTDIYEYLNCDKYYDTIYRTIKDSKYIISFNEFMKHHIIAKFNIDENKIKIIPQSVPKLIIEKYDFYNINSNILNYNKKFIMVGNLRQVKEPSFLFNYFEKSKNYCLIMIGKMLDIKYKFPKNVYHVDGLCKPKIYSIMTKSDGLINTSKSEGQSISILEALKLKCPVYVRNIEGNSAIIKHGYNGYIFNNQEDFLNIVNLTTENIIKNGYNYVNKYHNIDIEIEKYKKIL